MWHAAACGMWHTIDTDLCGTVYCGDCLACAELYKPVPAWGQAGRPTQLDNLLLRIRSVAQTNSACAKYFHNASN